jgi:hypothetical protein
VSRSEGATTDAYYDLRALLVAFIYGRLSGANRNAEQVGLLIDDYLQRENPQGIGRVMEWVRLTMQKLRLRN